MCIYVKDNIKFSLLTNKKTEIGISSLKVLSLCVLFWTQSQVEALQFEYELDLVKCLCVCVSPCAWLEVKVLSGNFNFLVIWFAHRISLSSDELINRNESDSFAEELFKSFKCTMLKHRQNNGKQRRNEEKLHKADFFGYSFFNFHQVKTHGHVCATRKSHVFFRAT